MRIVVEKAMQRFCTLRGVTLRRSRIHSWCSILNREHSDAVMPLDAERGVSRFHTECDSVRACGSLFLL